MSLYIKETGRYIDSSMCRPSISFGLWPHHLEVQ